MMRTTFTTLLLLGVFIPFLISCNESGNENSTESDIPLSERLESDTEEEDLYKIPPAPDTTIQITTLGNSIEEMRYDKKQITVPANARVKVVMENKAEEAEMVHNIVFVMDGMMERVADAGEKAGKEKAFVPDVPAVFGGSELAEPGEKTEFLFTAPAQSGEYHFLCTYPGHWEHMNGRFIVETVAE